MPSQSLRLSRKTRYGVELLSLLARRERFVTAHEAAGEAGLPPPFAAKILNRLAGCGLVESRRGGQERGFRLARSPGEISAREIAECLDGEELFSACVFWPRPCGENSLHCPLHECWAQARSVLAEALGSTSLEQLAARLSPRREGEVAG